MMLCKNRVLLVLSTVNHSSSVNRKRKKLNQSIKKTKARAKPPIGAKTKARAKLNQDQAKPSRSRSKVKDAIVHNRAKIKPLGARLIHKRKKTKHLSIKIPF